MSLSAARASSTLETSRRTILDSVMLIQRIPLETKDTLTHWLVNIARLSATATMIEYYPSVHGLIP